MNTKEIMAFIVTAMVVVTMFAAMIGSASATHTIGKYTIDYPGGPQNDSIKYHVGDTVHYRMCFSVAGLSGYTMYSAGDTFPDHDASPGGHYENLLDGDNAWFNGTLTAVTAPIHLNVSDTICWEQSWVVTEDGIESDGSITNLFNVTISEDTTPSFTFPASDPATSYVVVDLNFTYDATGCMKLTFTPEYTGPITWHQWIIGGVDYGVVNTVPVAKTHTFASCTGTKTATLKGGSDPWNYDEFTKDDIIVACKPVVTVERTPTGCVEIGDSVTFTASITTPGTPPYSYLWTFTNGVTGSSDTLASTTCTIPAGGTTATLTVTDDRGCEDDDDVSVSICSPPHEPPSDVPVLTPTGMVALIGMLCIAGAGRILTKGRRS